MSNTTDYDPDTGRAVMDDFKSWVLDLNEGALRARFGIKESTEETVRLIHGFCRDKGLS